MYIERKGKDPGGCASLGEMAFGGGFVPRGEVCCEHTVLRPKLIVHAHQNVHALAHSACESEGVLMCDSSLVMDLS